VSNWFQKTTTVGSGSVPTWAEKASSGVVESDSVVTYRVLTTVSSDSPTVAYDVEAETGLISGNALLPYLYVESDASLEYDVFSPVQSDRTATYRILTEASNTRSVTYRVLNAVTKDGAVAYELLGPATRD
jgi:hypothetical protein